MKIVRWSFENLHVPMIQDDNGSLCVTTKVLAQALGTTENALWLVASKNKDKLKGLSLSSGQAKEFLLKNKTELGIKRLKSDLKLWSVGEVIRIALWSRSSVSDEFVDQIVEFAQSNARITSLDGYMTREEYDRIVMELGRMTVKMEAMERMMNPDKQIKLRLVQ